MPSSSSTGPRIMCRKLGVQAKVLLVMAVLSSAGGANCPSLPEDSMKFARSTIASLTFDGTLHSEEKESVTGSFQFSKQVGCLFQGVISGSNPINYLGVVQPDGVTLLMNAALDPDSPEHEYHFVMGKLTNGGKGLIITSLDTNKEGIGGLNVAYFGQAVPSCSNMKGKKFENGANQKFAIIGDKFYREPKVTQNIRVQDMKVSKQLDCIIQVEGTRYNYETKTDYVWINAFGVIQPGGVIFMVEPYHNDPEGEQRIMDVIVAHISDNKWVQTQIDYETEGTSQQNGLGVGVTLATYGSTTFPSCPDISNLHWRTEQIEYGRLGGTVKEAWDTIKEGRSFKVVDQSNCMVYAEMRHNVGGQLDMFTGAIQPDGVTIIGAFGQPVDLEDREITVATLTNNLQSLVLTQTNYNMFRKPGKTGTKILHSNFIWSPEPSPGPTMQSSDDDGGNNMLIIVVIASVAGCLLISTVGCFAWKKSSESNRLLSFGGRI